MICHIISRKERFAEKRRERLQEYSKRMKVYKNFFLTGRLDLDYIQPQKKKDARRNFKTALTKNYKLDEGILCVT